MRHDKIILKELQKADKPMILLPGNHEIREELAKTVKSFDYIIYLHKGCYQLGDYIFFGYGNMGFSEEEKEFDSIAKQFKKTLNKKNKVVLITHGPPHGTDLDFIHGRHVGCKSITRFIKENDNILLAVSGHLHENFGVKDELNKARLINPGPNGEVVDV